MRMSKTPDEETVRKAVHSLMIFEIIVMKGRAFFRVFLFGGQWYKSKIWPFLIFYQGLPTERKISWKFSSLKFSIFLIIWDSTKLGRDFRNVSSPQILEFFIDSVYSSFCKKSRDFKHLIFDDIFNCWDFRDILGIFAIFCFDNLEDMLKH